MVVQECGHELLELLEGDLTIPVQVRFFDHPPPDPIVHQCGRILHSVCRGINHHGTREVLAQLDGGEADLPQDSLELEGTDLPRAVQVKHFEGLLQLLFGDHISFVDRTDTPLGVVDGATAIEVNLCPDVFHLELELLNCLILIELSIALQKLFFRDGSIPVLVKTLESQHQVIVISCRHLRHYVGNGCLLKVSLGSETFQIVHSLIHVNR